MNKRITNFHKFLIRNGDWAGELSLYILLAHRMKDLKGKIRLNIQRADISHAKQFDSYQEAEEYAIKKCKLLKNEFVIDKIHCHQTMRL
jgi:hypothetical protein